MKSKTKKEKTTNAALLQRVQSLEEKLKKSDEQLKKIDDKYQRLLEHYNLLKHFRFARKTEKNSQQLGLFDEAGISLETDNPPEEEKTAATPKQNTKSQKRGKRKPLPADLPREDIVIDISDAEKHCDCCGKQRPCIGEEISEKLDVEPLTLKVICYRRPKYGNCCEDKTNGHEGVLTAKLPNLFLPKSIAAPGLAAQIITSKFEDHLPLYRQTAIWKRYHVDLSRATLGRIVINSMAHCQPLYELLKEKILNQSYTQVDETPLKVLKKNKQAYMWVYAAGPPDKRTIVFDYQPSRSGQHAKDFLEGFKGHVQCDGYSGYHWLANSTNMSRGGCMAHARRKFHDVLKISKAEGLAQQAMDIIGRLYDIEKIARENAYSEQQRYQLRQEKALPIIEELKTFLDTNKDKVPPRHKLGEAFTYALNQWQYLVAYLDNGAYEIDNNAVENLIRPFAIGRKNWLFHGSDEGAKAGAMCYSLIATAKAHGLEPFAYLNYVFNHITQCQSRDDIEKLLPHNLTTDIITPVVSNN